MLTEQDYWEAIQEKLCIKCVDGNGRGDCHLAAGAECMVKKFLPQIIDVVNANYSSSMDPYIQGLRNKVCRICIHQSTVETCSLRTDVECALDRYFPRIVQVIEELQYNKRLHQR